MHAVAKFSEIKLLWKALESPKTELDWVINTKAFHSLPLKWSLTTEEKSFD